MRLREKFLATLILYTQVVALEGATETTKNSGNIAVDPEKAFRLETTDDGLVERVVTSIEIDGKQVSLVVDTGAGSSFVLFTHVAKRMGFEISRLPSRNPTAAGTAQLGKTIPYAIKLLGAELKAEPIALLDHPSGGDSEQYDGLFGWNAMRSEKWAILLAQKRFFVVEEITPAITKWPQYEILTNENFGLSLRSINSSSESPIRIIIDTGSPEGIMLPRSAWAAWKRAHPEAKITLNASGFTGIGGISAVEQSWAAQFQIGDILFETGIPIQEAPQAYSHQGSDNDYIALGLAALKGLKLVIDGEKHIAYMQASRTPIPPPRYNRIGAIFATRPGNSDLKATVAPGSPAADAGIRDGDILLAVDGEGVTQFPLSMDIRRKMTWTAPAGTKFTLRLLRNNEIYQATVVAADLFKLAPEKLP